MYLRLLLRLCVRFWDFWQKQNSGHDDRHHDKLSAERDARDRQFKDLRRKKFQVEKAYSKDTIRGFNSSAAVELNVKYCSG